MNGWETVRADPSGCAAAWGRVLADGLRIREQANLTARVVGSLGIGEWVYVWEIVSTAHPPGEWLWSVPADKSLPVGWVHSAYVGRDRG